MKFAVVLLATVLLVQWVQPSEGGPYRVKRDTAVELKFSPKGKLVGIFLKGVNKVFDYVKQGVAKLKDWVKSLYEGVTKSMTYLGSNGKKLFEKITEKLEPKAKKFKQNVEELKKLQKHQVTVKIRDTLVSVAGVLYNKSLTGDEVQDIATDLTSATNMETALFETINNDTRANPCVNDIKKEADYLRAHHLPVYKKCGDNAVESVKNIGKTALENLVPVKDTVVDAAKEVAMLGLTFNPVSAWNLICLVGKFVFKDIPTVYKTIKSTIKSAKGTIGTTSECILKNYKTCQEEWVDLTRRLAKCK